MENDSTNSPGAAPIDVSTLLTNAFAAAQKNYSAIAANAGGGGGGGMALATQGNDMQAQGETDLANVQAARDEKLNADNAAVAAKFGFLPGAAQTAIAGWAGSLAQDEAQVFQMQESMKKDLNVGFFDNPLTWLVNQVKMPFDIQRYNTAVNSINQRFEVLGELTKRASEEFSLNAAVDQVDATAKAAALSKIAFGQAKQRLADASFKAAQIGIEAQNIRLAATRDAFDSAVAVNNAQNESVRNNIALRGVQVQEGELKDQDIRTAIAQDQEARAKATYEVESQIQNLQLTDLTQKSNALQFLQGALDKATSTMGLNKMSYQQLQLMGDSPMKRILEQAITDPNIQDGRLGFDTVASLNLANQANLPLPGGQQFVREKLNDVVNTFASKNAFMMKSWTPETIHANELNAIQTYLNNQSANIPSTGSVFSPNPLKSVLEIPAVQSTDLAKDLNPLWQANPEYKTDANDFMAAAALRIQKGLSTPAEMAAQISQIYNAVLVDINQSRNFGKFSFGGLNSATGFHTSVDMKTGFGGSGVVDMTNKAAVEATLTRMILGQRLQSQFGNVQAVGVP